MTRRDPLPRPQSLAGYDLEHGDRMRRAFYSRFASACGGYDNGEHTRDVAEIIAARYGGR